MFTLLTVFFMYSLFNDASLDYRPMGSNERIISESELGKNGKELSWPD